MLVYRAANAVEAHALAAQLADEGVEARILGEPLQGAYAGIKLGGMDLPEVWVAEEDRQAAEPVIDAWRATHLPATAAASSDRFRFPLGLIFIAMAYLAIVLAFQDMTEFNKNVFGIALHLVLLCFLAFVAHKKLRAGRTPAEES